MNVTWEKSAERLLNQRGRFAKEAIKQEFEDKVLKGIVLIPQGSVEFDAVRKGYLTPVADNRFSVVWYMKGAAASVEAVVPVPTVRFAKDSTNLKARVEQIVNRESGTISDK